MKPLPECGICDTNMLGVLYGTLESRGWEAFKGTMKRLVGNEGFRVWRFSRERRNSTESPNYFGVWGFGLKKIKCSCKDYCKDLCSFSRLTTSKYLQIQRGSALRSYAG